MVSQSQAFCTIWKFIKKLSSLQTCTWSNLIIFDIFHQFKTISPDYNHFLVLFHLVFLSTISSPSVAFPWQVSDWLVSSCSTRNWWIFGWLVPPKRKLYPGRSCFFLSWETSPSVILALAHSAHNLDQSRDEEMRWPRKCNIWSHKENSEDKEIIIIKERERGKSVYRAAGCG